MKARLLQMAQALLWLAAAAASAVLVYWLHFDPVYGPHWSLEPGALLLALLGIYAAAGCLISLLDIRHRL